MFRNLRQQLFQGTIQFGHAGQGGVRLAQFLHKPAKSAFAVGIAHRLKMAVQPGLVVFEIAIVGKHPVVPPKLAHKRMAVLQSYAPLRGLADVGNDVAAFDGVAPHQIGHGRAAGGMVIDKQAQPFVCHRGRFGLCLYLHLRFFFYRCRHAFKKRNAPAVGMLVGNARALAESAETEGDVGWRVAIHSQKLAHGKKAIPKR